LSLLLSNLITSFSGNKDSGAQGERENSLLQHPHYPPLADQPGRPPYSSPIWRAAATELVGGEPAVRAVVRRGCWGRRLRGS